MLQATWSFIFSIIALCSAFAQESNNSLLADSAKGKFFPGGVSVGVDAISLIRSRTSDKFSGWEVNADVDFHRYHVVADFGTWATNYELKNGYYQSDGNYFRVGVDVNFLLKDPDSNMLFLGFRHGRSSFTDNVNYSFLDAQLDPVNLEAGNSGISANWMEGTAGLRVKVWKFIWMGYTGRMKFRLRVKGEGPLKAYDVPGYGLTYKTTWWGFNYQVFVKIPLKKRQ